MSKAGPLSYHIATSSAKLGRNPGSSPRLKLGQNASRYHNAGRSREVLDFAHLPL